MGNEFRGRAAHSAERFGASRDHWWHDDYLRFRAKSWELERVKRALDVGSGIGHWGRRLAGLLRQDATVVGVDRDPLWVETATERADAAGLGDRFSYTLGSVEALPFEDACFDLVTCQTVLMHLADPLQGLREMARVAKPGGLVLVAEPTNVLAPVLLGSITLDEPPERTAQHFRFQLTCHNGKKALGEGDSAIGERMPLLFQQAGLERVELRTNDRTASFVAPYDSPLEQAMREELASDIARGRWVWDREQTRKYFVAGGGNDAELDALFDSAMELPEARAQRARCGNVRACRRIFVLFGLGLEGCRLRERAWPAHSHRGKSRMR